MLPFHFSTTSAIALVLSVSGHTKGWPIALGGSQSIANALALYFRSLGGEIITGWEVKTYDELPKASAIMFATSPKELVKITGSLLAGGYKKKLRKYRYGMGAFKVDWILDGPVPFRSSICGQAGTVHIGNTFEEIAESEYAVWKGRHPERPFVLLSQQSLFDPTRTMGSKQVVWCYCHVPNDSDLDMTEVVEKQIERFAPGFRDRIVTKKTTNTIDFEKYKSNYIGGDINGGAMDLKQLFTRPIVQLNPYKTAARGIYLCSSSTPPGGGVHGMCGYHAAKTALKEIFNIQL